MTLLKSLTIVAAFIAGGTSMAMAQNGPATGGQPPVAGGAGGYPGYYYGAPGYFGAPGYAAPGYAVAPPRNLYMSEPRIRHKRLETGQPGPKQPHAAQ
jgi:hypothetical protein